MPVPFSNAKLSLVEGLAQPTDYSHIAHIEAEARRRLAIANNRLSTDPASAAVAIGSTYFEAAGQALTFYDGANAHDKAISDKRHEVVMCARYLIFVARTHSDGVKAAKRMIRRLTVENHRFLWRFIARELGPVHGENIANDLEQAFLEGETGTILNHLASMAGYSSLEVDEHGRRTIKGEWLSIVKRPSERAQRADARVAEPGTVPDSDDSPQGDSDDEGEDDSDVEADDLAREAEVAEEYDSFRAHVFNSDLRDRADEARRGPMSASLAACNAAFKRTLEPNEKDIEKTLATYCTKLNKYAEQFRGHGIKIATQKDIPIPPLATWPYSDETLAAALDLQRSATASRVSAAATSSTSSSASSVGESRASGQPSGTAPTVTRTTSVSDQSKPVALNSLLSRTRHPSLPLSYASAAAQSAPSGTRTASGSTSAHSSGTLGDSEMSRSLTRTSSDAGRLAAAPRAPASTGTTRVSGNMSSDQAVEVLTSKASQKRAQREDDLEDERASKQRRYYVRNM